MKAYERLINYTKYPTGSNPDCPDCPSNPAEWDFAKDLAKEMEDLGFIDIDLDENCYLMGTIPSNTSNEKAPSLGLIAHMDVSPEAPYENIKPSITHYQGGELILNEEKGLKLSPEDYPFMNKYVGKHILHTDGTTLLGADNKAGIADILTMAEKLKEDSSIEHGTIRVCFTPDEEIGRSGDLFNVKKFAADFAYTVDGGAFEECQSESFNAMGATITFNGIGIHTGSAKGKMKNALRLAIEFDSMLPEAVRPEYTEGYENFYHLDKISGEVEKAESKYLLRSFDKDEIIEMKEFMEKIADFMNDKYGEGTVETQIKEQYRNMGEIISQHPMITEIPERIIREMGYVPDTAPIRGGTDGARLSFEGLPCPNLGPGGFNFHSREEFAVIEDMDLAVEALIKLVQEFGKMTK